MEYPAIVLLLVGKRGTSIRNTIGRFGEPLLHAATDYHQDPTVIEILLEPGADIDMLSAGGGTATMHAHVLGNDGVVCFFLTKP